MEFLKNFLKVIKKKSLSIFMCVGIVFCCWYMLFNHYRHGDGNDVVATMENLLLDLRFLSRGTVPAKTKIGILAIDEKSLQQFGRWPFSRKYYSQAFRNLKEIGVKWIGFDSIFSEPERPTISDATGVLGKLRNAKGRKLNLGLSDAFKTLDEMRKVSPADREFALGISEFENIIMGFFYFESKREVKLNGREKNPFNGLEGMLDSSIMAVFLPEEKELTDYSDMFKAYGLVSNTEFLSASGTHFAFFSNQADEDAIVRWVTMAKVLDGNLMPSLALKMAAEYMERDIAVFFGDNEIESISLVHREDDGDAIELPLDPLGVGRILLNHRSGGAQSFRHFSLADAYNNTFTEEEKKSLKDSMLLLGATAIGINDQRPNPFDSTLDGVENHAAAIDNIVSGDFMLRPRDIWLKELGIILAIGLFFSPIMIWSSAIHSGILALMFLGGYYYFDQIFWFNKGIWTYLGMPFVEIITLFITITLYKYVVEEKEKRKVKGAFSHYLSPDVVNEVLAADNINLGGVRKECTVFFSDVRGFTTISESLSPEQLSQFMNEYFTPMTKIILDSKGCLDKYIGDAIMAFWGAPISNDFQADIAARASVDMLYALDKVQADFKEKSFPNVEIGIGLNTGEMSVGNMGSDERLAYTVMGDQVNLGARLEGLTKEYGIKIMISEFTVAAFKEPETHFFRDLDDIRVKGKNEPTRVYELMRADYLPQESAIKNLILEFEKGRELYRQQDWAGAEKAFMSCLTLNPSDGPANTYMKRIADYKKRGIVDNWDGVYTFTHK